MYGMDDVYMSPVDVMASFFSDGSVGGVGMEVGLFGPEMGEA